MIVAILALILLLTLALYYWSEWDDENKYIKHSEAGYKGWDTRSNNKHALKITDSINRSTEIAYI